MADIQDNSSYAMRQMDDVYLHSLAAMLEVNIEVHDLHWSDLREHTHMGSGNSQDFHMTLLRHGPHYDLVGR